MQSVHVAQSDDFLAASPTTYLVAPTTGEINQIDSDLSPVKAMSRSLAFGVLTYSFPRVDLIEVKIPTNKVLSTDDERL